MGAGVSGGGGAGLFISFAVPERFRVSPPLRAYIYKTGASGHYMTMATTPAARRRTCFAPALKRCFSLPASREPAGGRPLTQACPDKKSAQNKFLAAG